LRITIAVLRGTQILRFVIKVLSSSVRPLMPSGGSPGAIALIDEALAATAAICSSSRCVLVGHSLGASQRNICSEQWM
jgi:hypothetical protein